MIRRLQKRYALSEQGAKDFNQWVVLPDVCKHLFNVSCWAAVLHGERSENGVFQKAVFPSILQAVFSVWD